MKTTNTLLILILLVSLLNLLIAFNHPLQGNIFLPNSSTQHMKQYRSAGCLGEGTCDCQGASGKHAGGCGGMMGNNAVGNTQGYHEGMENLHKSSGGHTYVTAEEMQQFEIDFLTEDELADILHLRQEEKLARDVYRTLGETYQIMQFQNIPESEQKHVDAMEMVIERYQLTDPIIDEDARGSFQDEYFTRLYNELTGEGQASLVEALKVGATIEDMNMNKLLEALETTDNEDLTFVYESILEQSKHHMQAFLRGLAAEGVAYTSQYVDQAYVDSILSGAQGSRCQGGGCDMGGYGNGKGMHSQGGGCQGEGGCGMK